jgi:hypothetical protein
VTRQRRPVSVVALLAVAGVLGLVSGLLLGGRAHEEADEEAAVFDRIEARAEHLVPLGAPVRAASPSEADPRSLRGIPPYPNARPRSLGEPATVMGMPLVASWFTTPDSPDAVLAHYERLYADAGVQAFSTMFDPGQGYIAWLEEDPPDAGPGEGQVHMVSVIRNTPSDHETIVLLSASRPQRLHAGGRRVPEGVLLPEGARPPQVVELAIEGRGRTVVTTTAPGDVRAVVAGVAQRLREAGWQVEAVTGSGEGQSVIGRKGPVAQSIFATAGRHGDVSLMYTVERPRTAP